MSNFKPSDTLNEFIAKRDVEGIKNALYIALNTDRSFSIDNFDNILNYAKERVPEFISADKGETFKPESEWTENYWTELAVSLRNEFTMEKVRQLKKMSAKLYPPRNTQHYRDESTFTRGNQSSGGSSESPKINPIAIAVGAAVVIGIIIIAIAAGK
ncbi:hypothetical protein [Brachyspira hampsonii]|uniref:Uncharacterized protein n=1 Tax=Brachyspira hampsonii 30446 TaxID=1289135 RepID=A0A2U4FLF4_9SPIR|nr:hypothetical protein [Brachyspira hampsonii]EKV58321.1 hypothetical protein A966_01015 [Brachyspira hampsonii 30446]MBW5390356.1 hypothetical protein [Brachyspira hampsonii]MBW5394165.1 hypothetical protein [Brachyspira hampsonii]OEJ16549.1 hypothetical protein A9495_08955 [Brachyspira hampsonii]